MMTPDQARAAVGHKVIYRSAWAPRPEEGVITSVGPTGTVFVRYGDNAHSKGTAAWLLTLLDDGSCSCGDGA